jgi:hypothetical protein
LNQTGHGGIGNVLSRLADAIEQEASLGDRRAGYLDQVRFIAERAAAEPENRQSTIVEAVFHALRSRLQDCANIAQVLTLAGPAIARHFGIPWPF